MRTHEKIRKLREAKDLTQEYMAHELNISPKTYSRVESGESALKVEHLLKISELLEVPVEDLLSPNPITFHIEHQDFHEFKDRGVGIQSGTITNNYQNEGAAEKTVEERLLKLEQMMERLVKGMG